MSRDNMLFAGALILVIAVLASFCLYFGTAQPSGQRDTTKSKNEYLITMPSADLATTLPAPRRAASTLPSSQFAAESATPPSSRASEAHGGTSGGHGGGRGHR